MSNTIKSTAKLAAACLSAVLMAGCASITTGTGMATENEASLETAPVDRIAALNTQLGVGYLREGKNDLAFRKLSKALEIQPDYSGAHNAIALLYERLGQVEKANKHFQAALDHAPLDSAARNNYGSYLCRQGRVDDAIAEFEAALRNPLYQTPGSALTNAGLCLYREKRVAEAEEYLRRALEYSPKQPPALLAMSEITAESGRELSARGYLQRFLENEKPNSQSLWLGVRIERKLGDLNAASSYALLLKANYPDAPETRLLLESEPK